MPQDRQFVGFDAYQKAMDCLKPGDIAIFATPLAFRWVHFAYAIQKGLNVFMEKPVTADGPTSRRMLKLAEEATAKNLKVGVGLMSRHSRALQQLAQRIQDGEIGDLILMRGYRMHGPIGSMRSLPKPAGISEVAVADAAVPQLPVGQRRVFQRLLHPHHRPLLLDEERLAGQGPGAGRPPLSPESRRRHLRRPEFRYVFRGIHVCRRHQVHHGRALHRGLQRYLHQLRARHQRHGDRLPKRRLRAAFQHVQRPGCVEARTCSGNPKFTPDEANPYQNEWNDLVDAIRNDKPYNEVKRGVEASLVTSMGRMAAHTGREITFEQMLNCDHEYRAGRGQADDGFARTAAGRRQRQVSRAAAGHHQQTGKFLRELERKQLAFTRSRTVKKLS